MAAGGSLSEWAYWPDEPVRMMADDVGKLFAWCFTERASDVTVQTDQPVFVEVDGILRPVTRRPFDSADIEVVLTKMYGSNTAMGHLADQRDLDWAYEVYISRDERVRYRVNATGVLTNGRDGVQITARSMPSDVPRFGALGVPQAIVDAFSPRNGIVLVTGPTGSGKSTLLAAGFRYLAERPGGAGKILTYEAPIEFVHEYLDPAVNPHTLVAQSAVGRNIGTFEEAIRNALRRKPGPILVGEARDRETIAAAVLAAQTGHPVYSTAHTVGVAETVRRMIAVFPHDEQMGRGYDLLDALRLIVTQILERKVGGGRVALREYLAFTPELRATLMDAPMERWVPMMREMVAAHGQSMADSAREAFAAGLIDRATMLSITGGDRG